LIHLKLRNDIRKYLKLRSKRNVVEELKKLLRIEIIFGVLKKRFLERHLLKMVYIFDLTDEITAKSESRLF